jgi:nucleotide-binding universal stress UspA family protein
VVLDHERGNPERETMMRTILVGLDGPASNGAVDLGIRWAKANNALLVGIGIIDEPSIRQPEVMPIGGTSYKDDRDEAVLHAAVRSVEQELERFALRCAEAGVACKLLEDVGTPADQIGVEAQRYDLILLGKSAKYKSDSVDQPDDTLRKVLRNAPRPVVAVPDQPASGRSIVIAYDGSVQASRTLQAFQSQHLKLSGKWHVVTVDPDHAAAVRHAERAIDFLDGHGIQARRHVVASTSPAEAIMEQARKLEAEILVMGAFGQSALREFFFGSVTRTLLAEKSLPLFLYH